MNIKKRVNEIIRCLEEEYPGPVCSLEYEKDYELLFATRLAAQCTDERVNKITPDLYGRFPTLESLAAADIGEVEELVRTCGFYRTKARDIVLSANAIIDRHGGKVPDTMEELLKLPGVGRKTANLILGDVYGQPSYVVDTHCMRLTNRMGIVKNLKDPVKIEMELRKLIPPEKSTDFCHRTVLHGRAVCSARRAECEGCCLAHVCEKNI